MQWNSVSEFLAMGGYGFYVWISFGITAICMLSELMVVRYRYSEALKHQGMTGVVARS
jgi:heme exporter protein D